MATRAEVQLRLELYRKCETAILSGAQEYEVEDKRFRRADLKYVQGIITSLENELDAKSPSKKRIRTQRVLHRRG